MIWAFCLNWFFSCKNYATDITNAILSKISEGKIKIVYLFRYLTTGFKLSVHLRLCMLNHTPLYSQSLASNLIKTRYITQPI